MEVFGFKFYLNVKLRYILVFGVIVEIVYENGSKFYVVLFKNIFYSGYVVFYFGFVVVVSNYDGLV